ncbi:hypothetical protein C8R44DRAFT_892026 [Mycena epipterygia]|nr:hypothetical protein C8R44DRAFT_892026 [Mycena epipterygia]
MLAAPSKSSPSSIPGNLTVIFATLADESQVHVKSPIEEDYRKHSGSLGVFPLPRAITEFSDRALGGDSEWTIPERHGRDKWWRRPSLKRDNKDASKL